MIMILTKLWLTLPSYTAIKEVVFEGKLEEKVVKKVVLKNTYKTPISYYVI